MSIVDECQPLVREHHNEISPFVTEGLDPDYVRYHAMECAGFLHVYTVRDDIDLVGYSSYVLFNQPHCIGIMHAHHDALYVQPEYRKVSVGARLLAFCEQQLERAGVGVVFQAVSTKCDVSELLIAMKYQLVNHVYAKQLREMH